MIEITDERIDTEAVLQDATSSQAGAVVLFCGNTREFTDGKQTVFLSYECYREMALAQMDKLRSTVMKQWDVLSVSMVHRIGQVDPGQTSVAIAVGAEHREEAFLAGKWLIDTLKEEVPIWKKEDWSDGSSDWIHPPE